jgi:hypothetical protein
VSGTRPVPLSQTLGLGQRDTLMKSRDSTRDTRGTVDLKALARKVLSRDSTRDTRGTAAKNTCPIARDAGTAGTPVPRLDIPADWQEGIATLQTMTRPENVPAKAWASLVRDSVRFVGGAFAAEAAALGWSAADLWCCHATHPYQRLDCMGALWLLGGHGIAAVTAQGVTIRTGTGSRLTCARPKPAPGQPLALAWQLPQGRASVST